MECCLRIEKLKLHVGLPFPALCTLEREVQGSNNNWKQHQPWKKNTSISAQKSLLGKNKLLFTQPPVTFKVPCTQPSINKHCEPMKVGSRQLWTQAGLSSILLLRQKNMAHRASVRWQKTGCVLPKRPSDPLLSVLAEALLSRFLFKLQAAHTRTRACVELARGMRRALPLTAELRRHRFRQRAWRRKQGAEKQLCVTFLLSLFPAHPSQRELGFCFCFFFFFFVFFGLFCLLTAAALPTNIRD